MYVVCVRVNCAEILVFDRSPSGDYDYINPAKYARMTGGAAAAAAATTTAAAAVVDPNPRTMSAHANDSDTDSNHIYVTIPHQTTRSTHWE